MKKLNYMSLFAGIGGLDLGLDRAGMNCVAQVEIDDYCRRVLAKHWPDVPRHDDVRTAADWWLSKEGRPRVDVICGGFPCQDISVAGRKAGIIDGERSSLWAYLAHTVRVLRPRYVLVENVSRLVVSGLDVVAADLAEIGYDLEWDCIPAAAIGARHRRDRWFGVAYPSCEGLEGRRLSGATSECGSREVDLADAAGERRRQGRTRRPVGNGQDGEAERPEALANPVSVAGATPFARPVFANIEARRGLVRTHRRNRGRGGIWHAEPGMGRVVDGLPPGVVRDRLKALGNAVVPQVAEYVGRLIVAHSESSRTSEEVA